jgi:hypothetical protein
MVGSGVDAALSQAVRESASKRMNKNAVFLLIFFFSSK